MHRGLKANTAPDRDLFSNPRCKEGYRDASLSQSSGGRSAFCTKDSPKERSITHHAHRKSGELFLKQETPFVHSVVVIFLTQYVNSFFQKFFFSWFALPISAAVLLCGPLSDCRESTCDEPCRWPSGNAHHKAGSRGVHGP